MHIKHLYGIWAITGSLSTLQEVLLQVKTVNQTSQLCCNKYGFKADAFIPRYSVCAIFLELSFFFLIVYYSQQYEVSSTPSLRLLSFNRAPWSVTSSGLPDDLLLKNETYLESVLALFSPMKVASKSALKMVPSSTTPRSATTRVAKPKIKSTYSSMHTPSLNTTRGTSDSTGYLLIAVSLSY